MTACLLTRVLGHHRADQKDQMTRNASAVEYDSEHHRCSRTCWCSQVDLGLQTCTHINI